MINAPKPPGKPSFSESVVSSHEKHDNAIKRKNSEPTLMPLDQQVDLNSRSYKHARKKSPVGDGLSQPTTSDRPSVRFMSQMERHQIDKATGRTFKQMFDIQYAKGRPLIIAKCLCSRHAEESNQNSKFIHSEFMDGNIVFEAIENNQLSRPSSYNQYGDFRPTIEQKRVVNDFISKDIEFWAINPFTKVCDRIAVKADVTSPTKRPDMAIDAFLSCDVKDLEEEEEDDHSLAYVVAAMYNCGYLVQKDQTLASRSVLLMKEADFPYCQADALNYALDINENIFSSLLELGIDPKERNEEGWNMIDVVVSKKKGDEQQSALSILNKFGYLL